MQRPVYLPNWAAYFTLFEDEAAVISLDLGLKAIAPVEQNPTLLLVSIRCLGVMASGLPAGEDIKQLYLMEEAIFGLLEKEKQALFAGKITSGGYRRLFFYLPYMANGDALLRSCLSAFPDREWECQYRYDPDWEHFLIMLHPDEEEARGLQYAMPVTGPETDPRQVEAEAEHWFYFHREAEKEAFLQWAEEEGFALHHMERLSDGRPAPYLLIIGKTHPLSGSEFFRILDQLDSRARDLNGYYDGWEIVEPPWRRNCL